MNHSSSVNQGTNKQWTQTMEVMRELKKFLGFVLTVAETSLHPKQFQAYKKLVNEHFYAQVKLKIYELNRLDQSQWNESERSAEENENT